MTEPFVSILFVSFLSFSRQCPMELLRRRKTEPALISSRATPTPSADVIRPDPSPSFQTSNSIAPTPDSINATGASSNHEVKSMANLGTRKDRQEPQPSVSFSLHNQSPRRSLARPASSPLNMITAVAGRSVPYHLVRASRLFLPMMKLPDPRQQMERLAGRPPLLFLVNSNLLDPASFVRSANNYEIGTDFAALENLLQLQGERIMVSHSCIMVQHLTLSAVGSPTLHRRCCASLIRRRLLFSDAPPQVSAPAH